jgi:hypothetical protein
MTNGKTDQIRQAHVLRHRPAAIHPSEKNNTLDRIHPHPWFCKANTIITFERSIRILSPGKQVNLSCEQSTDAMASKNYFLVIATIATPVLFPFLINKQDEMARDIRRILKREAPHWQRRLDQMGARQLFGDYSGNG